ncbi:MAG TPA: methyltransferase domain-containing protein [Dehalococcoidia bacterium]|nr:methyltransferase domain-containing protein [Dehalococcoidia bacterium]
MTTTGDGQVKEAVRDQWTHAAEAWTRWHPKFSRMSREATEFVCDAAQLEPGMQVLDLAGGTGEPGLTAAQRVAPGGTVVCTDFVPGMVAAAEANARAAGITNMKFQQVDAEDIPFEDASFDRVVSRWGVMFFPNTQKALSEIRRVLKPGSRATFAVWQAVGKNGWFNDLNELLRGAGLLQPPAPGMPTPFRFGESGSLPRELEAAGFREVAERPHELPWCWPGPPEEYLQFIQATFPAWRRGLESAEEPTRARVLQEMHDVVSRSYDGDLIRFGGHIFIVTAVR